MADTLSQAGWKDKKKFKKEIMSDKDVRALQVTAYTTSTGTVI